MKRDALSDRGAQKTDRFGGGMEEAVEGESVLKKTKPASLIELLQAWKQAKANEWLGVWQGHEIYTVEDLELRAKDQVGWNKLIDHLRAASYDTLVARLLEWNRERVAQQQQAAQTPGPRHRRQGPVRRPPAC